MNHRRYAAVLLVGAGIAGCGSSSGLTPAAYRAKVNQLCAADNAAITALPSSDGNSVAGLRKEYTIETGTIAKIKQIKPPSSISGTAHAWLGVVEDSATVAARLLSDLKSSDVTQEKADLKQAQALNGQDRAKAAELKLTRCEVDASPSGSA